MHVPQGLTLDVKSIGLPHTRAHENSLIAVPEQIIDADCSANVYIWPYLDPLELQMTVLNIIQHTLWQTKLRYAIAEHAADFVLALEDRDLIAISRQNNCDGNSRRAGAYYSHPHAVGGSRSLAHLGRIGGGNIVFNGGKMHGSTFSSQNTVPLALVFMVAYKTAHRCQRVVHKQHLPGLVQLILLQQADNIRNRRIDRAALPTLGNLASEAAVGLVHNMKRHKISSLSTPCLHRLPAAQHHSCGHRPSKKAARGIFLLLYPTGPQVRNRQLVLYFMQYRPKITVL